MFRTVFSSFGNFEVGPLFKIRIRETISSPAYTNRLLLSRNILNVKEDRAQKNLKLASLMIRLD
jgi:hypothetical protein